MAQIIIEITEKIVKGSLAKPTVTLTVTRDLAPTEPELVQKSTKIITEMVQRLVREVGKPRGIIVPENPLIIS